MKLFPDELREILNEMELADQLFTEKRWAARFGISIPTVRRLRRVARKRHKLIPNGSEPADLHIVCFNGTRKTS